MIRALWLRAPFALRRYYALLAAIVACSALAAVTAAATPFVHAAVESESLRGELLAMSPLSAGLDVDVLAPGRLVGDPARRAALVRLTRSVPYVGRPILSSRVPVEARGGPADGLPLVAVARTGAVAHVRHLAATTGAGVWIADTTAHATGLRPGGQLRLASHGQPHTVVVRVKGIYAALAGDAGNPYWLNWLHEIRSLDPLAPDPAAFVLMSEPTYTRVAARVAPYALNRFELPVDPTRITFTGARRLQARLAALGARLQRTRAIGCVVPRDCHAGSSLGSALTIAAGDVAAVSPTISLLSNCGLALVLGLSLATGVFLVRRRRDEMHALHARGEAPLPFGTRTAVESLLPAVAGGVAGFGLSFAALRLFARAGTIDAGTIRDGASRAALATLAAVAAAGVGAALAFSHRRTRRALPLPWEVLPLAATAALLGLVLDGAAVARGDNSVPHPRLAVFILPILAVAGATGLVTRVSRRALRGRGGQARPSVFLAVRRVAAARGLLVVVIAAIAASFGTFAYAATLEASLERGTAEKAYLATGSDVQAYVDPSVRVTSAFRFPVAIVELDQEDVAFASGARVDLIAGDPQALAHTVLWGRGWDDDPRPLLKRLQARSPDRLLALATTGAPSEAAIDDQGARIPIRIVGRAPFPAESAGRPALIVSRSALRRFARRAHILEPAPLASGLVWAKGAPSSVEPALLASNLGASYLTTRNHLLRDPSVVAATRSYRYLGVLGIAAAALSLVGLTLYLHARQRGQLIASLFARRMGLRRRSDVGAVALEAAALVLVAAVTGMLVAVATAWPIVGRLDTLPQYAPPPAVVVPWLTLMLGALGTVGAAAIVGVAAVALAVRGEAGEALRVA